MRRLSVELDVPFHSLDSIVWQEGWGKTPEPERECAITNLIAEGLSPPNLSWFQSLKFGLLEVVPVPRPIAHLLVGLCAFLLAWGISRRMRPSWFLLVAPLIVGLTGEALDVFDALRSGEALPLWDSTLDVVWTVAPAALLLWALRRCGYSSPG